MEPEKHVTVAADEPMTKAELKKLRKQEKLQAKRAAAEELKKTCLRDHLKREHNFTLETQKRVFQDWEQMCADVKYAEVQEEMQQIMQNVQMAVDRKNLYIERLFGDRDEMEDIYSRNMHRLKRLIDCYLVMHKYFVENLSEQYNEGRQLRLTEFRREVELKESHANECVKQMEGALISLEEDMQRGLEDDRVEFIKQNDETINTHIERGDRLRDRKIKDLEAMHGEIKSVIKHYFTAILSPKKRRAYNKLHGAETYSRKIIDLNLEKLRKFNNMIKHLHKKIIATEVTGTRKIITKRLEKRQLQDEMDTYKQRMRKLEQLHMEDMKDMAYKVFHVQKHLTGLHDRGKLILGLAQTCAKYECDDDRAYFKQRRDQGRDTSSQFEFLSDKIRRVRSINVLLREERDQLKEKNRELQRKFQEYCKRQSPAAKLAGLKPTVRGREGPWC